MVRLIRYKNRAATTPPIRGETTQLATICPMVDQFTTPQSPATMPAPITAPMMEWVVETGAPSTVATLSHKAPASNADNINHVNSSGLANAFGSMMPPLMVRTTSPPAMMAPSASNTAAIKMAQPKLMAPDPTAGPMLLATSLAPMFMAMEPPTTPATIRNHSPWLDRPDKPSMFRVA